MIGGRRPKQNGKVYKAKEGDFTVKVFSNLEISDETGKAITDAVLDELILTTSNECVRSIAQRIIKAFNRLGYQTPSASSVDRKLWIIRL